MKDNAQINSWDDVDAALKRMGEIDIEMANVAGEATLKINDIKEAAKVKVAGAESERKHLEKLVTIFCEGNKDEFAKKRSKDLNFGTIGFRLVKNVSLPRDKAKIAELLKNLKAYGLNDCIEYEEKPDKDKIAELADESIVKLGLKRTVKDSFRIQPSIEKIRDTGSAV